MAYAPGFEIDVFISYAHRNNEGGWVTALDEYLTRRVPEFLEHQANVVVWRDKSLGGFDQLWPTLQQNIANSALFVSICSPVYVTSANCAKEVEFFLADGRNTPRIDRKSRMARLAIIPYARIDAPLDVFRRDDTLYYPFFEDRDDGTVGQFQPGSPEFNNQAERLAQHIAKQLRRVRDEAQKTASMGAPPARRILFVANASKDRTDHRTTVLNEFKDHELLTIPDGAYSTQELTDRTREMLARANYAVHLLGEKPGITVDDGDEPISHLQYRLALAHRPPGFTQIVWAPSSLQPQPGKQQKLVESVRAFKPEVWNEGTEVLSGSLDELLRGIQGVLTREKAAPKVDSTGPLYLLCAKADLDNDDANLAKLRDALCLAGVLPEFPAFDEQDVNLADVERNLIAQSCATIIYYGRGGDGWVRLKRQMLLRVLGDLKAQGQHLRAIYLSEPSNTPKQAQYLGMKIREFNEARGFPPLMVLGTAGGFEPTYLKPLLERLSTPGQSS